MRAALLQYRLSHDLLIETMLSLSIVHSLPPLWLNIYFAIYLLIRFGEILSCVQCVLLILLHIFCLVIVGCLVSVTIEEKKEKKLINKTFFIKIDYCYCFAALVDCGFKACQCFALVSTNTLNICAKCCFASFICDLISDPIFMR